MTTDDLGAVPESPDALLADPRIRTDHFRLLEDPDGAVLLIGVVHDHPASVYRVDSAIRALDPDTVAVELPPLALPLFEAGGEGEMSAALAATDADSAAIDAHGPRFLAALVDEIRDRSPDGETLARIASNALAVGRQALSCRLASVFGRDRFPTPLADGGIDLDVERPGDPATVAEHERRHLSRSFSVLRAFERPAADEIVDAARERTMARALAGTDGTAVAVVGFEHLDGIVAELRDRGATSLSVDAASLCEYAEK
ncbi:MULTISPECIES: hypothetical protein [Halomicrobium]|uniref:TraB/GumN family protein n=2 Tax=Halomicrobium mukohataei TaxID=57705 RepID=C7NVW5_HALMD|nr:MULTISPECIES: hypothetical protein [Halomicrobium]ACV48094.1 hypothetical protein Hmuk_1981 [Halomicrobium mukohataei DSM 12286]QCD66525.1 hypothetical protein E5139_13020 [Halomicrobium mukohataei]QFR21331.1 hypothetical protein GBQ70_13035 [Halomicrobium sp. ZPS1]